MIIGRYLITRAGKIHQKNYDTRAYPDWRPGPSVYFFDSNLLKSKDNRIEATGRSWRRTRDQS
jgi:hypothetical protein